MFEYVIATLQYVYLEMGLEQVFNQNVSSKLDKQRDIDLETCKRLLIRCQLMLSLRGQVVAIFKQLRGIESFINRFAQMKLKGPIEKAKEKSELQIQIVKQ